jgi:hypothetical protein
MADYNTKQVNLGPLTRCHAAYYQEICVINACSENIVVIDVEGSQRVVEPVGSTFSNQTVLLHRRETMKNSTAMNGANIPLPGTTVEVPFYRLQAGPIYVEEFNVMVCTENDAVTCRHPRAAMCYTESLHNSLEMVCDKICDAPGIRLMANDPMGRYDELYTLINSHVITIPVTHIADDIFTLTLIIINNGKYHAETTNLNDISEGKTNIVEFTSNMIPFVTTSKANAESIAKSFRWLTPKAFAEYQEKMKREQEEALAAKEAQLAAFKADRDAKMKELAAKLTIAMTNLSQVQAERDDYKNRYQYLKGDISATSDMMSAYRDQNKYATDMSLAQNDLTLSNMKMQHQKEEATFKTWHLITAAAVPAVVAILVELFRSK